MESFCRAARLLLSSGKKLGGAGIGGLRRWGIAHCCFPHAGGFWFPASGFFVMVVDAGVLGCEPQTEWEGEEISRMGGL
jgi:hypothetical protein